jgi:ATP synthase protein I
MATDETGQDPKLPPDARLDSLERRLDRLQEAEAKRTYQAKPNPTTRVWQLMFGHLVGAPVGGGVIGWGLDTLFGTFPTMFLIMLFVGFGVGVVNVMRVSKTPPDGSSGTGS